MLQAVVAWSVEHRVVVILLAVLLLAAGMQATSQAQLDVFPDFAPPQVVVQTEAPGLSPLEVEQRVTVPIEAAVNGVPRLDVLRSQSLQGLSVITAVFQDGTDVYRARQQIGERLAEIAGQLPSGVKAPRLAPLTPTTGRLLTVGFTAPQLSPLDLRDRVQWLVRPRLLAVRGVAQVTLFGGDVRQFQVQVQPDFLAAHQLTIHDVLDATRQASGVRGAGFLENANQRLTLRVEAQVHTAVELGETVIVKTAGAPVRLRDVALVVEAAEPKFGDAHIDGVPGMLLIVHKQVGSDTLDVTRRVEQELARLTPMLERDGITVHTSLFRQANFIERAIANVAESLLLGAVLVALVLSLFLFDWRTAFISLTAIPLSLLGAVLVLVSCGVGLNTLTLGGLAIAVGEVVDDAIIDVENIHRRLLENARLAEPRSTAAVVLAASLEVRGAVVYATFIVVLVFLPVFFLTGLQGRLFAPLGYAYILAVLTSLGVALTVTPALALLLLAPTSGGGGRSDTRSPQPEVGAKGLRARHAVMENFLKVCYDRLLRRLDGELPVVLTLTTLLVCGAAFALWQCGGEFLPELRENHFVIHMRGLPGTSLQQSLATGDRVNLALHQLPEVRSVSQQAGRAELGEDPWGVEYNELEVDLTPLNAGQLDSVSQRIRALRGEVVGFSFEPLPFLTERIKETLSGTTGTLAIKLYGNDLPALDRAAQQVAQLLGDIRGHDGQSAALDLRVEAQTGAPELVVRPRPRDLEHFGLRRAHVLDAVHTAYQGAEVGQTQEGNRTIDLVVILEPSARNDPEALANLWLTVPGVRSKNPAPKEEPESPEGGPSRGRIQLRRVADVFLSDGRFLVGHEGGLRRQVVTCNVGKNLDVDTFVRRAEDRMKQLKLTSGVSYTFTGEHEARRTAERELLHGTLLAGAGILLLLGLVFRSPRRLLLVLVNLPFALVGGVAAVYLGGGLLDVGALVGFVTLFGITMRNAIMMVSHWQHLHEVEGMAPGPELVFRGARERLVPVLMTALVTALGLLPIALGSGEAGREIEGPMARVILGGLVTSTALNLLVLPVLYRRFGSPATVTH
jgi:CzcA family heavy metal efflux pump